MKFIWYKLTTNIINTTFISRNHVFYVNEGILIKINFYFYNLKIIKSNN